MRILRECTTKVITWGLYARNCEEVDAAAAACIGCGGPSTPGVALIDVPAGAAMSPIFLGIIAGLFVGKQLGIVVFA